MKSVSINFQLRQIELLESHLNNPQIVLKPERSYHFNINIEQKFKPEEELVNVETLVEIVHDEDLKCHASLKTSCVYWVENLSGFVSSENQMVQLPTPFEDTLNSISLSTTRGVQFACFKGTFMNNVNLPIVNPTDFKGNQ